MKKAYEDRTDLSTKERNFFGGGTNHHTLEGQRGRGQEDKSVSTNHKKKRGREKKSTW